MPMTSSNHQARLIERCRAFLPPDAFDAHVHFYQPGTTGGKAEAMWRGEAGQDVGFDEYRKAHAAWLGDRTPTGVLAFAMPALELDIPAANAFLARQVAPEPGSRALMVIRPDDDPDAVEAQVERDGFVGFKVYHIYADRERTFHADIDEFLPEWAWGIAHRRRLAIMLHMVRPRALADERNQRTIIAKCRRYPGAKLILAHAARGFCARHTTEAVHTLRGLDNVYFDTSGICEPEAFEAILDTCGPRRLLFGTDFPVSEKHDRCVSVGDGFLWLDDAVDWSQSDFAQPVRVGVESLLALGDACGRLRLCDADIEHICGNNARRLLDITPAGDGSRTQARFEQAGRIIPGGTQLLSKRPDLHAPGQWPAYFSEARGCEVVDLDGRRFIDMHMSGIGACLLGYNDPHVTDAVLRRVQLGSMSTLNPPEEVELAERLIALHPWAEQARFARTGGEAMAIAVRLARAVTERDRVAFCGYHGWCDWYLAANRPEGAADMDALREHLLPGLEPAGVPRSLAGTALPFRYNRFDELQAIAENHGEELAAVVMEPTRGEHPEPGFLENVRQLCDRLGAVCIIDEITAGWRFNRGGAHLHYGLAPDVAVFAKALGNGHPMAAVIGRAEVMQAAQRSFISSTYWTESVGPTAALATLDRFEAHDVPAHVHRIGELMRAGWHRLGEAHGLPMQAHGHAPLLKLGFDHEQAAALGTLLTTRMLERGFLMGGAFYPTLAHTEDHIQRCLDAADEVVPELAAAAASGDVTARLPGPIKRSGFARLT